MKREILILIGIIALILVFGVSVMASGPSPQTTSTTATVTVNSFLSVSLTNAPVQFPSMDPGTTKNATVGYGFPLNATIGSESNVNPKVKTKADNASFTGGTLAVSNMQWSPNGSSGWTNYLITDETVCASVSAGGTCNIYHQLTIPANQAAGSYSVGITITATTA